MWPGSVGASARDWPRGCGAEMTTAAVLCLIVLGAVVCFTLGFLVAALMAAAKRGDGE